MPLDALIYPTATTNAQALTVPYTRRHFGLRRRQLRYFGEKFDALRYVESDVAITHKTIYSIVAHTLILQLIKQLNGGSIE